jgi:hypothetical protein
MRRDREQQYQGRFEEEQERLEEAIRVEEQVGEREKERVSWGGVGLLCASMEGRTAGGVGGEVAVEVGCVGPSKVGKRIGGVLRGDGGG